MKELLPIPKKVVFLVVGMHVLVCVFFFFSEPKRAPQKKIMMIQAKHYTLEKEMPKSLPTKTIEKPKERLATKKTLEKKITKKNELITKNEDKKKSPEPKKKVDVETQPVQTPTPIKTEASLPIEQGFSEKTYVHQVGELIQKKVLIKNSGRVSLQLKLSSKGELLSLEILSASDGDLIGPLKEQIKALDFPSFDATMKGKKNEVFTFEFFAN